MAFRLEKMQDQQEMHELSQSHILYLTLFSWNSTVLLNTIIAHHLTSLFPSLLSLCILETTIGCSDDLVIFIHSNSKLSPWVGVDTAWSPWWSRPMVYAVPDQCYFQSLQTLCLISDNAILISVFYFIFPDVQMFYIESHVLIKGYILFIIFCDKACLSAQFVKLKIVYCMTCLFFNKLAIKCLHLWFPQFRWLLFDI